MPPVALAILVKRPRTFARDTRKRSAAPSNPPPRGKLIGLTVADPESPEVQWTYGDQNGRLTALRRADGAVERFVLDYAFGSGRHATTFVGLTNRAPAIPP